MNTQASEPENPSVQIHTLSDIHGSEINIAGRDVIQGIVVEKIEVLNQQILTAAEEAAQARRVENQLLAEGVAAYLRRLRERASEPALMGNPYKGLLEYKLADASLFYGRDQAVIGVLESLGRAPLAVLHAESGAGKSSLIQAAIIPQLIANGHLPLYLRPYDQTPTQAIKRVLIADLDQTPGLKAAPLRHFLSQVGEVLQSQAGVYIFLDQFEEFFTRMSAEQRQEFIAQLADCLEDESLAVSWMLSLRSEYFSNLAVMRPRIRDPFGNDVLLKRLSAEEARQAIIQPAKQRQVEFEDQVVDAILQDLGDMEVAPPQVQLVCQALFDELPEGADQISLELYEAEGRAAGILRGHLERVLNRNIQPEQRRAARGLLEALVNSEQQRVLRTQDDLVEELSLRGITPPEVEQLLGQMVDSRLLRVVEMEDRLAFELVHDYLVEEITLHPEVRARKTAQELLAQEVRAYQRHGTLLSARRLAVIEPYQNELILGPEAQKLLVESRARLERQKLEEEARRQKELEDARRLVEEQKKLAETERLRAEERDRSARRARRFVVALLALLGLAVVTLVFALWQLRIAQARKLATQAEIAFKNQDLHLAALLALQANKLYTTAEARALLSEIPFQKPSKGSRFWGHSGTVATIAWSLDGRLASGAYDQQVILWDLASGEPEQILQGHQDVVVGVAWSPEGQLASASMDGVIILWDLEAGKPGVVLDGQLGRTDSLAWSPDGRLAAGYQDGSVLIWEASGSEPVQVLKGHTQMVEKVAWSAQKQLASADRGGEVILWDLRSGKPAKSLKGHTAKADSLAWSPDGRLASGSSDSADQRIILWDLEAEQPEQIFWNEGKDIVGLSWSPDGILTSSSSDGSISLWDVEESRVLWQLSSFSGAVKCIDYSKDGRLASGSQSGVVVVWDMSFNRAMQTLSQDAPQVVDVAWFDDHTLASAGQNSVLLWDLDFSRREKIFPVEAGQIRVIARSSEMNLAIGLDSGEIQIWNIHKNDSQNGLQAHDGPVTGLAWSQDGRLASSSTDGAILIWDLEAGKVSKELHSHAGYVGSLSWSPDGHLVTGASDGLILIWDLDKEVSEQVLSAHQQPVNSLVWLPDGRLASSSADQIILWEIEKPQPEQLIPVQGESITDLTWSPGFSLVSSSEQGPTLGSLSIYAPDGKIVRSLTYPTGRITGLDWSPDGRVAFGTNDAKVLVFPEKILQDPCAWLMRNLSENEWLEYVGYGYAYKPLCSELKSAAIQSPLLKPWVRWGLAAGVVLLTFGLVLAVYGLYKFTRRKSAARPAVA